jgi:hypothetical protein
MPDKREESLRRYDEVAPVLSAQSEAIYANFRRMVKAREEVASTARAR